MTAPGGDSLDRYEKKILRILQEDVSLSPAAVAERVGLSVSPCWRRIDRLERDGFITRKVALVDRRKVGLNAHIFAQVKLNAHGRANLDAFAEALGALEGDQLETQTAMIARDEEVARIQDLLYGSASIVEGIYRQAGMIEEAERIRPTARRVSGREANDEGDVPTT